MFVRNNSQGFNSAIEFANNYTEVTKPHISSNKYYPDYMAKLDKEMQKFNGKIVVGEGTETNSEMTSATKLTKKSS